MHRTPDWKRVPAALVTGRDPRNVTNVYLGSELAKRIRILREHGHYLNVSAVCQDALQRAVTEAERHYRVHKR